MLVLAKTDRLPARTGFGAEPQESFLSRNATNFWWKFCVYYLDVVSGIAAAKKRTSTYFIKCNELILQLKRAKIENRLENRLKHYAKYKLLIIDEIGYLPIDKEDAKLFFQLIDLRYEKKSTILTTNVNFKAWDEVFQDSKLANAILDRVLHHATVINIIGDSYRIKDHLEKENE